jgi:hypothetical protein
MLMVEMGGRDRYRFECFCKVILRPPEETATRLFPLSVEGSPCPRMKSAGYKEKTSFLSFGCDEHFVLGPVAPLARWQEVVLALK